MIKENHRVVDVAISIMFKFVEKNYNLSKTIIQSGSSDWYITRIRIFMVIFMYNDLYLTTSIIASKLNKSSITILNYVKGRRDSDKPSFATIMRKSPVTREEYFKFRDDLRKMIWENQTK